MKPTSKWNKMNPPTKKKPAKRKNNPAVNSHIIDKLLKLKYRINDVYQLVKEGNGKPKFDLTILGDTRTDKQWVMTLIDNVRAGGSITKERMLMANKIWKKYA